MAYTERQFKERMTLGQSDNALMKLIAITLIMFVGLAFMKAVWYVTYEKNEVLPHFKKEILDLFIMPADFDKLLSRPWTLITHMFVHTSVWQVFANMLWLWSFGYIMQDLTGNKKIFPFLFMVHWPEQLHLYWLIILFRHCNHNSLCSKHGCFCRGNGSSNCYYNGITGLSHFPNDTWRHTIMGTHHFLYPV